MSFLQKLNERMNQRQVYYEYDNLILGKDWCWDQHGIMIPNNPVPDDYSLGLEHITSAINVFKDLDNSIDFLEVSSTIEDYEVDDAIIIHLSLINHWGHWLLDGMVNFWPLFDEERPSDNIMIIHSRIPFFFPEVCKKYLISRNHFIIPKRIKKAYIPQQTMTVPGLLPRSRELQNDTLIYDDKAHKIQEKIINSLLYNPTKKTGYIHNEKNTWETVQWFGDLHRTPPTKIHKKVFLSRGGNTIEGAEYHQRIPRLDKLEYVLEKTGQWSIIRMHDHSIGEQLNILENADIVTGAIGSAFHGLLMTRHFKGKVIYLVGKDEQNIKGNYKYQNKMMDLDAEFKNVGTLNDSELEEITKYLMEL